MIVGFLTAVGLGVAYRGHLPFGYGLTSGCFGLAVNLLVYIACAYLIPRWVEERERIDALFRVVEIRKRGAVSSELGNRPALT